MNETSRAFTATLVLMQNMHEKKSADYGTGEDPFANLRQTVDMKIPPWVGVLMRINDKLFRLKRAASGSRLQNESAEDTFLDIAVYAVIGLILYREEHE